MNHKMRLEEFEKVIDNMMDEEFPENHSQRIGVMKLMAHAKNLGRQQREFLTRDEVSKIDFAKCTTDVTEAKK